MYFTGANVSDIKVGDLVMVVRGHECVVREHLGVPHTVRAIVPQTGGGWHCNKCNKYGLAQDAIWAANLDFHAHPGSGIPLGWLKRITPLSELGDVEHKEEQPA
jgi:hypothetical protein